MNDFRQVCILRKQGRHDESIALLEQELPKTISQWAQASPLDAARKRSELQIMFRDEERRIDDAWAVQQFVSTHLRQDVFPALSAQIANEVRGVVFEQWSLASGIAENPLHAAAFENQGRHAGRTDMVSANPIPRFGLSPATAKHRISFDNVSGLIDALSEQERRFQTRATAASRKPSFPKVDQDHAL